jgi:phosphoribosylaminoimidazolecarboxamide formyltransferase/IMP cyclohydrolase
MITVLISVYDKTGLTDFLKALKKFHELRIIATTSTADHLKKHDFACTQVESLTGFPEILGGRVKTLHPKIFAGILARERADDEQTLKEKDIWKIDMVIVNLYPFEAKLTENLSEAEMTEFIDIGGVSLLRAAAKNFERVSVIHDPQQYAKIERCLAEANGQLPKEMKRLLAQETFARTASYDQAISAYFARQSIAKESSVSPLPSALNINLHQYQALRYGENPHQAAVWYAAAITNGTTNGTAFPPFAQLQGKEMSSNNITDTYCLVKILREVGKTAACIIKHNNPCGVALGSTIEEAYKKAYDTDPMSAFGGIYGFTRKVTGDLAKKIVEGFVEIVAAPDFDQEALTVLASKKNLRVLKLSETLLKTKETARPQLRDLQDFGWILEKDIEPPVSLDQLECVAGEALSEAEKSDVSFAWGIVKHLTSNAIFVAKNGCSLGFGIGQTSRIASVEIALAQAGNKARGAVLASDAFFPAVDNIEAAHKAGIATIVQPGGSLKDADVIKACKQAGIKMLFTGQRCFKH